jgi:hypothetical protein
MRRQMQQAFRLVTVGDEAQDHILHPPKGATRARKRAGPPAGHGLKINYVLMGLGSSAERNGADYVGRNEECRKGNSSRGIAAGGNESSRICDGLAAGGNE